jgi:4-methylaminobutanoate oxidase (formaldehyde-forming)
LRPLLLDDADAIALGGEPVRVNNHVAGRVTSGGYGYTIDRSIAYAYLPPACTPGNRVDVQVFGRWVPATVASEPLYDPTGERIRS